MTQYMREARHVEEVVVDQNPGTTQSPSEWTVRRNELDLPQRIRAWWEEEKKE